MNDDFTNLLWDTVKSSPDLQKAMMDGLGSGGYSIPTRVYCEATGAVEDIHFALADFEDQAYIERLRAAIEKVDRMTIGELAQMLSRARLGYVLKEVQGGELTEPEKTLRDIDITKLALVAVLSAKKVIGTPTTIKDIQDSFGLDAQEG